MSQTESQKFILETDALVKLLTCLIDRPYMFSFIEQWIADELEARALFSLSEFRVTQRGVKYLNERGLASSPGILLARSRAE